MSEYREKKQSKPRTVAQLYARRAKIKEKVTALQKEYETLTETLKTDLDN